MDQEKIGKFIATQRKSKKLTQSELGRKLGVTDKSISRWENGKTMPDYAVLKDLCDTLGITINELLSGEKIKTTNYEFKLNENLDNILKEYYKIKKQKNIITSIFFILLILFVKFLLKGFALLSLTSLTFFSPSKNITGIENYNKKYFIEKYGDDLDSNLSIFPFDTKNIIDAKFYTSLQTNLFDSDGYIILTAKYNEEDYEKEIDRLSKLKITISENCLANSKTFTNYVKYDENSYEYKAYISVDGFKHTYEYALINEDNFEIDYIYLSYPNINILKYKKYLKKDKSFYLNDNTLNMYSMYYHSFDNKKTFTKYNDCDYKN